MYATFPVAPISVSEQMKQSSSFGREPLRGPGGGGGTELFLNVKDIRYR